MSKKLTKLEFIEKSILIHGDKLNNLTKIKIICKKHDCVFEQTPANHLRGKGCKLCSIEIVSKHNRKTKEQVIIDFIKVHYDKYDYSLVEYVNNNTKVKIICKKHNTIFEQLPSSHLMGAGCPKCWDDIHRVTKEEFIERSILIHGDKYDYSLVDYNGGNIKVKIICPEHGIFEQTPNNHMVKNGCSDCSNNKKSDTNDFIQKSKLIHGDKYDYSLVNYINSQTKVKIICKEHGVFLQKPHNHINKGQKQGCPDCNESKGERDIRNILNDRNISYIRGKRFDGCKYINTLPFDFYLPDYNACIEFDGIQHYLSIKRWGGEKRLELSKKRDKIKNEYCLNNNIRLLRIKYDENIEEKLTTFLIDKWYI